MRKIQTKPCKYCGEEYEKHYAMSQNNWDNRSKYCSRSCLRRDTVPGFTGKHHTKEIKELNRISHTGENNVLWKGGISKLDSHERSKFRLRVRKIIFERDKHQCVECSSKEYLQITHIKSFADFPELRFEIDNCRTLCMGCHYKETYDKILPKDIMWGFTNITHYG